MTKNGHLATCRLCNNSHHLSYKFAVKQSHLYACRKCGFVQVGNKPTKAELDEIYSNAYFSHSKYSDRSTLDREHGRRFKLMKRFIPTGRILDYGCAAGDYLEFIRNKYEMYGMDPSGDAIVKAKAALPNLERQLSAGTIHDADYPSSYFDGIVMWDVIEHLWNPLADCTKLLSHLKPGGTLIVSTPNIGAPAAKVLGRYWAFMTPPEHLGFFRKQTIAHLFENMLGCRVVQWFSKGKWANVGFLMYKANRIVPGLFSERFMRGFRKGRMKRLSVYVPTGDIQYAVIRKPE